MINLITIHLQAINDERNIFRQYEIYVGKDLFEMWNLTIAYGRIHKISHIKAYPFQSCEPLFSMLIQILKKRLSSHKRLGTNYRITAHFIDSSHLLPTLPEKLIKLIQQNKI
ncbi:hypothetical protein [Candidatus Paracaedibacter symbiosus]|uniref:hypothetical protein n=1 Tax=Candidatus Paracaedibacter symbiosus TaxID=244582 RepID=UPI000509C7BC|nr:hypothetical protein [Candidatus Paracaedibacter symbiosus]